MKKELSYFEECAIAEFPEILETREITRKQALKVITDYDSPYPTKILNPLNTVRRGVFRFNANLDIDSEESLNLSHSKHVPETPKHTETDEELDARIRETYDNMETLVDSVGNGITKSMIVSGAAGLGKSYGIQKILENNESEYIFIKGFVKPTGIFKVLYENRFENQVICFDDSDSIFWDETGLNLLKGALELKKTRRISWLSEKQFVTDDGEDIPKTFDYQGTIIFLTNLDFNVLIDKGNRIAPHLEALRSRSIYFDMKIRTRREILCRINQVVKESTILSGLGISVSAQESIMEYLRENSDRAIEISLRTVEKLAALYKASPYNWKSLANSVILK